MFSLPPDRVLRNIPEPKDFPSPSRANHAVVRCHSFWGGSQSIRNIVFLFLCIITSLLTSNCHSVSQCPFCCNFSRVVHSGRASQQEHSNSIGKQRSQGHSLGAPMPGLRFTVIFCRCRTWFQREILWLKPHLWIILIHYDVSCDILMQFTYSTC